MNKNTNSSENLYMNVEKTHREWMRLEARTGSDWARDGYNMVNAQIAVDKAKKNYTEAFMAYAESVS